MKQDKNINNINGVFIISLTFYPQGEITQSY